MSAQLKPKRRRSPGPYQEPSKRTLTKEAFFDEVVTRHGPFKDNWAFTCPNCGGIQTVADFKNIDVDPNAVTRACIGRYVDDRGCNCLLSGDQPHFLDVVDNDSVIPCFEIA